MSLPLGSETQLSQNGARLVYLTSLMAGEDINANTQRISDDGTATYISTATTTLIATGRGVRKRIVLGETAAASITTDSLFVDPTRPWLGLKPGSPCQSAGAYIQGAKDRFGRRYLNPPNIGPWTILEKD